jgi:hypothetical protein
MSPNTPTTYKSVPPLLIPFPIHKRPHHHSQSRPKMTKHPSHLAHSTKPSTQASEHIDRTRGTVLALPRMAAEYELEQVAADAMAAEALFNNAARRYDLTVKKWQILTKLHVEEKIKEAKEEDEKL